MQILSQKQTNHYLNGMHIHEFFNMSVEQQAGLLLVCMQVQQFQIAADAARLVLSVVFEVMELDWFPLVVIVSATSPVFFSHRFPSSPLTSHAVFLKANIHTSEILFLFCL